MSMPANKNIFIPKRTNNLVPYGKRSNVIANEDKNMN